MSKFMIATLSLLLSAGVVHAQSGGARPDQGGNNARTMGASAQGGSPTDQAIAGMLLLGNQEEIAMAQFAEGRAQNDSVKEFARMMIKDHQQAVQKIQQAAPQLASMNLQLQGMGGHDQSSQGLSGQGQGHSGAGAGGAGGGSGAGGSGAGAGGSGAGGSGSLGGGGRAGGGASGSSTGQGSGAGGAGGQMAGEGLHQVMALHQAIHQQCLELSQRELGQKQGAEFDMAYVGQQIVMHTQMLAKLQASQQFASGDIRTLIGELTRTVQMHHDHAKQLADQLKGQIAGGAAASRDASRR